MGQITINDIHEACDLVSVHELVERAAMDATYGKDGHTLNGINVLRFLSRYASWNGYFGSGVATLAGKVGRCRHMFIDSVADATSHGLLGDRSVFVASYFFDAARDEFNDRDTEHRDTHRCLAQSTVAGVARFFQDDVSFAGHSIVSSITEEPVWLQTLNERVALGYGAGSPDTRGSVFRAIGYHLGSEILADQEFSIIDRVLRENALELVTFLESHEFEIEGLRHNSYAWIRIHSGDGGAVEAEHFEAAMQGARLALKYSPEHLRDELRHQILLGVVDFADDQQEFFNNVNEAPEVGVTFRE